MKYWLVGAEFDSNDALPKFIRRSFFYCWDPKENDNVSAQVERQMEKMQQMQEGDRIAVKKRLGHAGDGMEIRAIGIVESVSTVSWRAIVNWVYPDVSGRIVESKGCMSAINGPFERGGDKDEWLDRIFTL